MKNKPDKAPEKSEVAIECFLSHSMNTLDANDLYFDTCLHTTVSSLERMGLQFKRTREKRVNRQGRATSYTRYELLSSSRNKAEKVLLEKKKKRGVEVSIAA